MFLLGFGSIAPKNGVRLSQRSNFVNPLRDTIQMRSGGSKGVHINGQTSSLPVLEIRCKRERQNPLENTTKRIYSCRQMIAEREFGNNRPFTWIGTFPVYLATALAGVHALTMIFTAIALGSGAERVIQTLVFSSTGVLQSFDVWQVVTYAFVHRPPYLFFLIELYMLAVFGAEIEKFLGRWAFLKLYLLLLLLPPLVLSLATFAGVSSILVGSGALNFAVFVAFAALYPRAEIFFSIQARWVALGFFVVNAIQCYALGDITGLGVLVLDCGAAVAFIWNFRTGGVDLRLFRRRFKVVPKPSPSTRTEARQPEPVGLDIDPILEKISRSGLASLTAKERDTLEMARAELLSKERDG